MDFGGIWENIVTSLIWVLANIIFHHILASKIEKRILNKVEPLFIRHKTPMTITQVSVPQFNRPLYTRTGKIQGGWEPGRPGPIDTIVYHWMAGNLAGTDATFKDSNKGRAAHFGIEDTTVHQYVKIQDTAFHATNYAVNQTAVGIEHSAQPGRNASEATYESSAQIVLSIAHSQGKRVGDFKHVPHSVVSQTPTDCCGTLDWGRIVARAKELEGNQVSITTASALLHIPVQVPVNSFAPFEVNLSPSQHYSDEVKRMQEFLVSKGFMKDQGSNDGYYGPVTEAAVNGFQKTHGIVSDKAHFGWWYDVTRAEANKELIIYS